MSESRRRPQVFEGDDPKVQPTPGPEAERDDGREANAPGGANTGSRTAGTSDRGTGAARADDSPDDKAAAQTLAPAETDQGWSLLSVFISVFFLLSSLAIGLWFTRFISVALARDDWIGWTANAMALVLGGIIAFVLHKVLGVGAGEAH